MKRGLVDLSSVLWTCLFAGKDTEFGREVQNSAGKPVWVNSHEHGFENAINHLTTAMEDLGLTPHQLIFVVEGRDSKAPRKALHPVYKGDRDKVPEHYEQFNELKRRVFEQFKVLGSQFVTQDRIEADDVIAYLARQLQGHRYIISGDKDLAQLVGPGPNDRLRPPGTASDTTRGRGLDDSPWTGYIHHYRQGQLDKNPFGPFPHNLIPVYIALVGDTSDKIPGVRGFGAGAFEKLLLTFNIKGLEMMEKLIQKKTLVRLSEDVSELKELQKIIDGADGAYLSYTLGQLWHHKVNTVNNQLVWDVGMVKADHGVELDGRLKQWASTVSVVHAGNYDEVMKKLPAALARSPYVALDVETSTPAESDEWIESLGKTEDRTPVDVMGSELASLQLTFGANLQHTIYFPIDHVEEEGCLNVSIARVRDAIAAVPRDKIVYIHNKAFELPVCFNAWGQDWLDDDEWHGFVPNAMDTKIGASYVNENIRHGLKDLSKHYLDHIQQTYAETVVKEYTEAVWLGLPTSRFGLRGKVLARWNDPVHTGKFEDRVDMVEVTDPETGEITYEKKVFPGEGPEIMDHVTGPVMVRVEHKMNELTARQVLSYGADDTICTAALANHFATIMEIEGTWDAYCMVEQLPAYVTAKAFVDGADFSHETMRALEKEDEETHAAAWKVLRSYLMDIGYAGTRCPEAPALTPAAIKEAHLIVTGVELKTLVKTPSKLAKLIFQGAFDLEESGGDSDVAERMRLLATLVDAGDVAQVNALVARHFQGEPQINLGSSKQLTALLYDRMGLPVRVVNDVTDKQEEANPDLVAAMRRFKRRRAGHTDVELFEGDEALIRSKAKANAVAMKTALAFDSHLLSAADRAALESIATMKTVETRQNLFYRNYWPIKHWKTGKIHAQTNQCAAVTRRYSMSNPNLQQLPKKGEGVKFRGCFIPHKPNAVICSIDFSGQELRLAAERSQDANLLACYVGDHLKDVHSLTAAFAMKVKWGPDRVKGLYAEFGSDLTPSTDADYELFLRLRALGKHHPMGKEADDLRKESKNVNFTAQFGGTAPRVSETLIMPLEDAQLFLDARSAMFPDVDKAAERAADACNELGYATTLLGVRRHLRETIRSDDSKIAARAERQAWNHEIQGSAGEMTKLGMARLWKSGALHCFDVRFIAPVHDELVTSVVREHVLEFTKIKHECMTQPYATMKVPVMGSISIGPNFADQWECGDWYIEEDIRKALDDIFAQKEAA